MGFGLGGQLPVAVSLVSEFAPPAVRGRLIVLLESFWGLGWLAAALASWGFIPHFGWHSAFWIGALPIFYALWVWKKLPESVPYLLARGRVDEAHALVSRLEAQTGLLRKTYNIIVDIIISKAVNASRKHIYSIIIHGNNMVSMVLESVKLTYNDEFEQKYLFMTNNMLIKNSCCKRSFIRGAFLSSGSVSDPEKAYHFEIVLPDMKMA